MTRILPFRVSGSLAKLSQKCFGCDWPPEGSESLCEEVLEATLQDPASREILRLLAEKAEDLSSTHRQEACGVYRLAEDEEQVAVSFAKIQSQDITAASSAVAYENENPARRTKTVSMLQHAAEQLAEKGAKVRPLS